MSSIDQKTERPRWGFLVFVISYTAVLKVLPFILYRFGMDVESNFAIYPWAFSPIFAVCLFGGAMYQRKGNALWIPLIAIFAGDLGIWAVTGKFEWAFYPAQVVVYSAFILCAVMGFMLRKKRSVGKIAGAGIASCVTFFLITNFASWVGSVTYPQTIAGLIQCYEMGLPFLRNSLIGTAIFGGILFSPACILQTSPAETKTELLPATSV